MSEKLGFRDELKEKGVVPVGVDIGYSDYASAVQAFQEFMTLPENILKASRFKLDDRKNSTFGAYTRRVGELSAEGRGVDQDNKDIFHYGIASAEVLKYRLGGKLPIEAQRFLKLAEEIYRSSTATLRESLSELDWKNAGLVGIHFSDKHPDNHHLRFVAYRQRQGSLLASPHFDRSVATIALAENKPGLWFEKNNQKLPAPPRRNGDGLFFLGAGWDELPVNYLDGNYDLEPTLHGVDQISDVADGDILRWAIILFANPYHLDTVPAPERTRPYKALGETVFREMPVGTQEPLSQNELTSCLV